MKSKTWLSLDEAVEYLGIGKTKLYQLANDAKIPASKLDKQWRFNSDDLDAWLKSSKTIENFFTSVDYSIEDNDKLREPQKEGYKAVYDYFKKGGREALVQLPVGCGKSGLASITPFGISRGRVLVVTPNVPIREEMHNNLDVTHRKCFWKRTEVLRPSDMLNGPYVCTLDTGNISVSDECHLVVSNIQRLSVSKDKWLNKFDPNYFDLIIVDEAHHSAAISWEEVMARFPQAKILHLTATPFRSDNKEVRGERVYRYPFKSAVVNGYIKRLTAVYVTPKQITLSFKDKEEKVTYTLDEVLKLKEEEWFSRGIALSDECNKSIVDNSIEKLERLRFESSVKHQIIAAAMTINHAKQIALLYQARNYETAVIHSKMKEVEKEDIYKRLRNNELDVVVNVSMLGEGFDHQQLSVAAIFTPYRSLKPYLQFVGRIMRVIHQNSPGDPDNYGFIVTHSGMNIDTLFDQFQLFEKDDEEFWAKVVGGEEPEPPNPRGAGISRKKLRPDLTVHGEIIEELVEQSFIDESDVREQATREFLKLQGYGEKEIEEFIKSETKEPREQIVKAPLPIVVQPQRELEMLKKRLSVDVNSKAKAVLDNARLPMVGTHIPRRLFPGLAGSGQNNLVACIVMINQEIKKHFGDKERDDWSISDYKKAIELLPTISSQIVRRLIKAKEAANAQG